MTKEEKMQRSNSSFYVISMIVVFAVASFFYSWKVIIPEYQKNKTELKKLDQEIVSANAKLESLRVAKKDIDELGPIFDQLFVAMPKDKDEANVISEIEAIAYTNNLAVPSIQIADSSSAKGDANVSAITISFNVSGSFESIDKMTKALENDLKFMNIKSVSLSLSDTGLSASYQIEAYKSGAVASLSADATTSSEISGTASTIEGGL
jgi:Tfp pilus assembly protein PilO